MQYPYYIMRVTERMLNWFFEPTKEKIYCQTIEEMRDNFKLGDSMYALNDLGKYKSVNSYANAELTYKGEWRRNSIPDNEYYKERK